MSIAYTYTIVDNTTGTDVYVGSSKETNRLYFHERPENTTSSRQIINNGDYHFEIYETFRGNMTELELRKQEQKLMNRMRKVYKMNVVNPKNAYTSEYHRKLKQKKNRNENKDRKRAYDYQRNHWMYSWGEKTYEPLTMFHIKDDVFQ